MPTNHIKQQQGPLLSFEFSSSKGEIEPLTFQ